MASFPTTSPDPAPDDGVAGDRPAGERLSSAGEEHAALLALRASEEKYRALFESIDEGFCTIEVLFDDRGRAFDYRFLEMNPAFERHSGLTDAAGRTVLQLAPQHEEFWFETYGRIALTGQPIRFEHEAAALGKFFDVYAFRVGEPGENRVAAIFSDIYPRKRAEAALRQSDERQKFLLRLSDAMRPLADPLEVQDLATRMLGEHLGAANVYYYEALGDEDQTQLGRGYSTDGAIWPERFRLSDYGELITHAFRRGETVVFDDVARDPRVGEAVAAAFRVIGARASVGVPLVKNGRFAGSLGVHQAQPRQWLPEEIQLVEDVAERTWAAVERARADEAVREADRRKSEFLAMLGHELRNPLAAVEGGLKLLQSPRARPESRAAALPIVVQQVAHMKRLIDDVLDLARLDRGKLQVQAVETDLDATLRASIAMISPMARAKASPIRYAPPRSPIYLQADPERLVQVFANLLANALKFSPPGSAIDLRVEPGEPAVIHIRDYGQGIAAENLKDIFEPFVQSKLSLGLPEAGLGLGLSVSRELVELHGGKIAAFSDGLGRGSTFVVSLPLSLPR